MIPILDRLRHASLSNQRRSTSLEDEKTGQRYGFYFEGGIQSYVKHLNVGKEVVDDDIFYVEKQSKSRRSKLRCNTPMPTPKPSKPLPTTS